MVSATDFFAALKQHDIGPFVGVPCSLINSLIAYATDHPAEVDHVNPAHESHAMAYAAGTFMATGKLPMVYMQNSGFGNIINPLTSLHQIYDIPALLLVTWRSEKGYGTDAPEHWIVGRDMEQYFKTFCLPYRIMHETEWRTQIKELADEARATKKPVVLCVKKGMFEPYTMQPKEEFAAVLESMDVLRALKNALSDAAFLSTTGMLSRESFTVQDTPDFYMMGSMGLISGIAAGCAENTDKLIVALDGDGAAMMHMGQMPFIGNRQYKNLVHVVLDNAAYSSTGGQPSIAPTVDFALVAKACGYAETKTILTMQELTAALATVSTISGPTLWHIKVRSASHHDIARVSDKYTCPDVARNFSHELHS